MKTDNPKRIEALRLVGEGMSYREIARILKVSHSRIGQYVLEARGQPPGSRPRGLGAYRKKRRDDLLKFIIDYKTQNDGNTPSLLEMAGGVGYMGKSGVFNALRVLQAKGKIEIDHNRGLIRVVGGLYIPPAQ